MHKVKSTYTIINIIHLILWIWSFQTYQHPRSNDINEVEEERSQNKHKKGQKTHFVPGENDFPKEEINFLSAGFQIWRRNGMEIDFPKEEINFLSAVFKKSALGGIKLD